MSRSVYLLDLPDFIILHIFRYLRASDLILISLTCERFARLSEDKILVRKCDFSDSVYTKENEIRDYAKIRSLNITILNLNNCFWLRESAVSYIVKKCTNVVELHVLQCKLSITTLAAAIRRGRIGKLSWSYQLRGHTKKNDHMAVQQCTWGGVSKLTSVILDVCEPLMQKQQLFVSSFLERCKNVQSLTIYMSKLAQLPNSEKFCEGRLAIATCWLYNFLFTDLEIFKNMPDIKHISLPICINSLHHDISILIDKLNKAPINLKTFLAPVMIIQGQEVERGMDVMKKIKYVVMKVKSLPNLSGEKQWEFLNIHSAGVSSNLSSGISDFLDATPNLRQLKFQNYAPVDNLDFLRNCRYLTHLSLSNLHIHGQLNLCSQLAQCPKLKHLALPVCALIKITDERVIGKGKRKRSPACENLARKRRVGISTQTPNLEIISSLSCVVEACPDMVEFELISPGCSDRFTSHEIIDQTACKYINFVTDEDIEPVSQWERLERLTMVRLKGLVHGQSIVKIAKSCKQLQHLTLVYIGGDNGNPRCDLALREALTYMPHLLDLRIEQPRMNLYPQFLCALHHCKSLQRLCVMSLGGTLDGSALCCVLEAIPMLTFMQISADISMAEARNMQRDLLKKFLCGRRPSLLVFISPYQKVGNDAMFDFCVPYKHFSEISCWKSRVCSLPDTH